MSIINYFAAHLIFWGIVALVTLPVFILLRVILGERLFNKVFFGIKGKIIACSILILVVIVWMMWSGKDASKSYYVTIPELGAMGDKAYHSNLRVEGFVVPGSIEQSGTHVTFVMNEFESHTPKAATGRLLTVNYKGSEPPPDTFKDDSQALAMGTYGRDGVFHATVLQAKCASKYAPAQPGAAQPGAMPTQPSAAPAAAPQSKPAS